MVLKLSYEVKDGYWRHLVESEMTYGCISSCPFQPNDTEAIDAFFFIAESGPVSLFFEHLDKSVRVESESSKLFELFKGILLDGIVLAMDGFQLASQGSILDGLKVRLSDHVKSRVDEKRGPKRQRDLS